MTHRIPSTFWVPGAASAAVKLAEAVRPEPGAVDAGRMPADLPEQQTNGQQPQAAHVPWSIYVPDSYVPNYAYPLVVWLHGAGGNEDDVQDVMPHVSDRNLFALGLRGNRKWKVASGQRWDWQVTNGRVSSLAASTYQLVCGLRRMLHIHSERIFLAGVDCGADMALNLLLRHPDWFAGAALLDARLPQLPNAFANYRSLQGKQLLLGRRSDGSRHAPDTRRIGRLFHTAGLDVRMHSTDADDHVPHDWLQRLNRWVLESSCGASIIS